MEDKDVKPEAEKDALYKAAIEVIDHAMKALDNDEEDLEKNEDDADGEGMEVVDTTGGAKEVEKSEESEDEKEESESDKDEDKDDKDEEFERSETAKESKTEEKSEETNPVDALKKSFDERFESLTKTIEKLTKANEKLAARLEKIAKQPVGRKGHSGIAPLRKSEEDTDSETEEKPAEKLTKSAVINQLLKLQKNGNPEVTPVLVGKVESGRNLTKSDIETVRRLLA
jgi:prefoldin subunit 5